MQDGQELPDWRTQAAAQYTPAAKAMIAEQTFALQGSPLNALGAYTQRRLAASATFAVLTFPAHAWARFSYANAYLIAWVYTLDEVLDTCLDLETADDLGLLLTAEMAGTNAPLTLHHDPHVHLPGLGYALADLVATLRPLRELLQAQGATSLGLAMFDRYLLEMILPAMRREAAWRLGIMPLPDYSSYLDTARISISGGLCVSLVNAVLPQPALLWQQIQPAISNMAQATRLVNDVATRGRDEGEGTPNAVTLLAPTTGSIPLAEAAVREQITTYASDLWQQCATALPTPSTPLELLKYYTYYCWVITEAMYAGGDFTFERRRAEDA